MQFTNTLTAVTLALASSLAAQTPIYHAARQPAGDPQVATLAGGVMLSVPGVFTDFVLAGGGQFVELPNGTARLTGRVFSDSSIYSAFLLDITFAGRTNPGDPSYPPLGGPDLALQPSAYTPIGSVDANTFAYYTSVTGTLVGVRNLDGAILTLTSNAPAQIGFGANNRNAAEGLEVIFDVINDPQAPLPLTPSGTATLLVDLVPPSAEDTTHPQPDPLRTSLADGRAMVLPGVGDDYVFVPAADFTEFADGHAELTGKLARLGDLTDAFDVSLLLDNRLTAGEANHPPVGSPVLQMFPSAYTANGGSLDPDHWHYYQTVTGTLTGTGINAGGSVSLTNTVAMQIGAGANQTNTYFGFYGSFSTSVVAQPTGRTLNIVADAELFGLTAIFAVLPFPTLTPPVTTPQLPTLTDQGFVLEGDNLAWVELVALGFDLTGSRSPTKWNDGYFVVLDNQHIEFHPRPGQVAGNYNVLVYNPAIQSNSIPVELVAPTTPQLFAEATVESFFTTHVKVHPGTVVGPALSLIVLSPTLAPSIVPGFCVLDIGNGLSDLLLDPNVYVHDPTTGIAEANYGPINPSLQGAWFYMQALILDIGTGTLPLPVTNAWRVDFN